MFQKLLHAGGDASPVSPLFSDVNGLTVTGGGRDCQRRRVTPYTRAITGGALAARSFAWLISLTCEFSVQKS
jgi:hypothetical protein